MAKVKVRTLRPLNGEPEGRIRTYEEVDAKRLAESGAVEILGKAEGGSKRTKAEGRSPSNKSR